MSPDGWRCRLGHPIDFGRVRREFEVPASIHLSKAYDTILDTLSWCSIEGPRLTVPGSLNFDPEAGVAVP